MRLFKIISLLFDSCFFVICGSVKFARKKGVKVGDNCRIYIKNWGSEPFLIELGDNVTVTSGVRFLTHDGATCLVKDTSGNRFQKFASIKVGNNVFIGVNAVIMPGVRIGNNVIVAAGSVVTKDLLSNSVYGGVTAKFISTFSDYEEKVKSHCVSNVDFNNNDLTYEERVNSCKLK